MSEKPVAPETLDFLFKDAKSKFWVAEGCFMRIVTGSKIKDIDVFSPDPTAVIGDASNEESRPRNRE